MQTLKRLLIALSTLSFLLVAIGFFTPGWMVFHMDIVKMTELQMKKASLQVQQQYPHQPLQAQQQNKERQLLMRKQNPNILKSMNIYAGPFYVRYCVAMTTMGVDASFCPVLSFGDIISILNAFDRLNATGPIANVMQSLKQSGSTLTLDSIINIFVAIVVISSLVVIQATVSLILSIVYTCIRYPRKIVGIAGGVSSIISGVVTVLIGVVSLIIYGPMPDSFAKSIGEAGTLGFPYSILLSCFGAVLFCIAGGLLIRVTLKSKEQFNYEMMVIDTSKGGGTYIAKT